MSSREELFLIDEDLARRKLGMFEQRYITSKCELLRRIDGVVKNIESRMHQEAESKEKKAYYTAKLHFFKRFRNEVNYTPLFNKLEDWWSYSFSVSSREAVVYLNHIARIDIEGDEASEYLGKPDIDAEFKLIRVKASVMTADEFAASRGVANATIRVWIRRGKLRSAFKLGNTWMVPELTLPFGRGYSSARYRLTIPLNDIPARFGYLRLDSPGEIMFHQMQNDKSKFSVTRYIENELLIGEFIISASELEKLEAFLIANPLVEYVGDEEIYD